MKHTINVRHSHVSTYFSIAKRSYISAQQYSTEISSLPYPPDEDAVFDGHHLGKKEYNEVIVYIIFTALTAEALINKYLFIQQHKGKISKRLYEHIDQKMSTEDKWGIATQHFNNSEVQNLLDYGCEPMQSLINLFRLRNKLVHAKQSSSNIAIYESDGDIKIPNSSGKPSPYNLNFENTKHYIETVKRLMEVLQKLDPDNVSNWLDSDDWAELIIIEE